jgi:hypothetical protein
VRTLMLALVLLALFFACSRSFACSFDTDCYPGSKCIKGAGAIYGVCAGGMFPGNSNDRVPVTDVLDPNQSVGNTCSFDIDCGPGGKCLKSTGSIYGTCFR